MHLVGVHVDGVLAGIGGIELQGDGIAELKQFYVVPQHRGAGVADAVIGALLAHATEHGVRTIRLETGDKQRDVGRHATSDPHGVLTPRESDATGEAVTPGGARPGRG